MKQRTSFTTDEIIAAPAGAVVLIFGYEDGMAWAHTKVCLGMGMVRQREVHQPRQGDGFDRVGARLDWNDSLVPIVDNGTEGFIDHEISAQELVATKQTTMWEIEIKLREYFHEKESSHEPHLNEIMVAILEALRRVGIFPQ